MTSAGDFCNRRVVIARAGENLADAARRMRDEHVGSLVIVEDRGEMRVPIGMLTDRDIVTAVLARTDRHLDAVTVSDVMSSEVVTATEEEPLIDVMKRMRSFGVRRMPVVNDEGGLEGLVTFDDLVEEIADEVHDLATLLGRERRREAARHSA